MKKLAKRVTAFCCMAALAATCTMGAGAAQTLNGSCGGVGFTGHSEMQGSACYGYTSVGRSPVYGDRKQITIKGETKDSSSTATNTVSLTVNGGTGAGHRVWVNGYSSSLATKAN